MRLSLAVWCLAVPVAEFSFCCGGCSDFSSIWCFSDCICYGSRPLRLDYVEVWTSERAFEPYPKVVCIVWSDPSCRIVKSWFLVTSGDDIVWKALGGSDRSGLRRRSVFYSTSGLYHLAGWGPALIYPDHCSLLLRRLLHWTVLCLCLDGLTLMCLS